MSGGFEYFDIILFAMIAAFLVYRLGSVLGKRTGHERQSREPFGRLGGKESAAETGNDNVIAIPQREAPPQEEEPDTPLGAALTQIKLADSSFTRKGFLEGARAAFEMVITAFALGDMKTLRSLLSQEVYDNFAEAIRTRERANADQDLAPHRHAAALARVAIVAFWLVVPAPASFPVLISRHCAPLLVRLRHAFGLAAQCGAIKASTALQPPLLDLDSSRFQALAIYTRGLPK